MNSLFYPKLAASNLKKNSKTYIPYILSCIGSVVMYYIIDALSVDGGLDKTGGGAQLKVVLSFGSYVIAIFAVIFLFYTNSFIMKRRKKEFGLLNILGMEKRHISKIMFFETLYVAIIGIGGGLLCGFLFSKLMYLALLKILHLSVQLKFDLSIPAVIATAILFGIIFTLSFINTLRQIHLSKPVDLLKGGQTGEKEPKSKWLLTLFGFVCLAAGYIIALTTESPMSAFFLFFIAVVLVIIGTYALFVSGSITFLKLLRKKKDYYYQTKHFTSISGMIYRMKQNAVGLANICILSTAVLVMLSTTISLYIGVEDALRTRYTRNIVIAAADISPEQAKLLDTIVQEESGKMAVAPESLIRYRSMSFNLLQNGNSFTASNDSASLTDLDKVTMMVLMPLTEYNQIMGQTKTLAGDEALLYCVHGEIKQDAIDICGKPFRIKEVLNNLNINGELGTYLLRSYYLVVPDEETIEALYHAAAKSTEDMGNLSYFCGFDVKCDSQTQIALNEAISQRLKATGLDVFAECAEASRDSFYSLYGGLLFIGIFLGLLFIMATVLIIYYKQISEGYDDKERFDIMQKVGMSHEEVKKSIRSQVLTVFFLPLITAGIHIAFAFKVITKLLALLNLTNVPLFAGCTLGTILIFALFYAVVYALTAKAYYGIVK
ncbi:MAG: FtsX-like permease family protein [Clostridiaceae bacterium]|nr:FtsX-like permease family protein [Clostridiaceae bacterium]